MKIKKAQLSMEFLFAIGFILFVFLLLMGFVLQRKSELADTKVFLDKKAECTRIASLISSVYASGDGTVVETGTDYFITIYNDSSIGVNNIENTTYYERMEVRCFFTAESFSYNLTGDLTIRNIGGDITIDET